MKIRIVWFFTIIFLTSANGIGQEFDEDSNWYKVIGKQDNYYSRFDFDRYTKSEVENARLRYLRIVAGSPGDEWVGTYRRQTMLGNSEITWDRSNGFVYTYIYHTLASIDYGRAESSSESVSFVSEKPATRSGKSFLEVENLFVKFGEKHLLVPKSRLVDFAIWAVGREVPTGRRQKEIYTEEGFFWERVEDEDKKISDIPSFPDRFAHLIRKPIRARILSVGKMRKKLERSADWGTTSENHLVSLKLTAGRRQGVRVGMSFWVDELDEWVEVTSVLASQSTAELSRPYIDGKEICSKYESSRYIEFECRNPRPGMLTRTRVDYF